ncbi:prohibitin family protein [Rossellomorea marisflavi]|uniref:prohibitin family protein n=1 Tax=Rossellomorea marisflavi TaxID=189381 RepID=UPI003FA0A716
MSGFKLGAGITAFLMIVVLILGFMSIEVIPQGHAGVVYKRSSGVQEQTLSQGWKLVSPLDRVTAYPVSTETVTVKPFNVQTKDGKPLVVEMQYDYSNQLEKLPYIYNKFKGQDSGIIQEGWLQSRAKKASLNVFSKYSVLEVFQKQGEINGEIQANFKELVAEHGFTIDSLTLGAPQPDKNTMQAIQAVVDAQQKLEQLEIEKKQAKAEAEKRIETSKGEAEAIRIKSEADAKANKLLQQSISEELVKYKSLEKWDGKLPTVTGGSTPMISVPGEDKN